ncbi:hypothetical protein E3N88_07880 [Mikania micrantha]|uniref:Uncharacterized protein n=1 Tax=Mikania micrantha TaxID=192012 RepID=A0A5N6PHR6_9ASTR|nr:hypothetical protein E3N88_07880 [Mikania micrantha]
MVKALLYGIHMLSLLICFPDTSSTTISLAVSDSSILLWKVLDSAELKMSSISFFDIDKHESVVSRWARTRTKAAMVGKGLSKNCKAQKLALQHWLEAVSVE